MSTFSLLATILIQNKLTENNYVEWKHNLDIVLTVEDHIYVLSTPCPSEPPANEIGRASCRERVFRAV